MSFKISSTSSQCKPSPMEIDSQQRTPFVENASTISMSHSISAPIISTGYKTELKLILTPSRVSEKSLRLRSSTPYLQMNEIPGQATSPDPEGIGIIHQSISESLERSDWKRICSNLILSIVDESELSQEQHRCLHLAHMIYFQKTGSVDNAQEHFEKLKALGPLSERDEMFVSLLQKTPFSDSDATIAPYIDALRLDIKKNFLCAE